MTKSLDTFQLGNWYVHPKLNQLDLIGSELQQTITPKQMTLLVTLVQSDYQPLSIDELIEKVWDQRVVSDSSVYQAIAQLRKVLSEDAEHQSYIERISGQGYRIEPSINIGSVSAHSKQEPTKNYPPLIAVIGAVMAMIVALGYFSINSDTVSEEPYFESLTLASHLLTQREPEQLHQAKQLYLEVLKTAPENVTALNGLCNGYRLLSIYDTLSESELEQLCQPLLDKAYKLAPDNPQVLASLARQSYLTGQSERAEKLFDLALDKTQQEANIWHWYGQFKRGHNRVKEAVDAHQKAFRLSPNDPVILRGLAYANLQNRDLTNARKYYERSIVIAPQFKNKALYNLDFYPLNQQRAKDYLIWHDNYEDNHIKKYPAHRLSYALMLLSLGQLALAEEQLEIAKSAHGLPLGFLLYVQAAVAWAGNQPEQTVELLQQRYQLASDQNHYVMPYLVALLRTNQAAPALSLFEKHFPQISSLSEKANGAIDQYLFFAAMLKQNDRMDRYRVVVGLLEKAQTSRTPFSIQQQVYWNALNDDKESVDSALNQLLASGWLPDYNDSIFSLELFLELHSSSDAAEGWLLQLTTIQQCIWQRQQSVNCE